MKWNEVTIFSKICAAVLFIVVVPVICFYFGFQYGQLSVLETQDTSINTQNFVVTKPVYPIRTQNNYSPNGSLNLQVNLFENGECLFRLETRNGQEISPIQGLDFDTTICHVGDMDGSMHTGFIDWLDHHLVLITKDNSTVTRINIKDSSVLNYTPAQEAEGFQFWAVDSNLTNWVYREPQGGRFAILDENLNIRLFMEANIKAVFYDEANDTFIFLSKKNVDNLQSLVVRYVSLETYNVETILETKPVEVRGMGCDGWGSVVSVPGEVRLKPGSCYYREVVDYIQGEDGLLHIKL